MPPGAAPPRPHVAAPKARRLALGKLSLDVFPTYFNALGSERLVFPAILSCSIALEAIRTGVRSTQRSIGDTFAPSEESGSP